jgi:putative protease
MDQPVHPKKVELLAPGGDAECVKAAIVAGADAVYCGLPVFNARQRAENISMETLKELVLLAHERNCRIYLTLNTLILEDEFDQLLDILNETCAIGIDAVIVQDLGLLFFLKTYFPSLEVHASTQMTTHNSGQIVFLSALNIAQVNLARELSLPEIHALCDFGHHVKVKSEVFVHGAYCISFSGQCYMSSAMSGHSGNRGACVQPCRRAYYLQGKKQKVLPFNLKDNSAFSSAGALIQAGVDSVKIEGRIKSPVYVYTTVTAWRAQLDRTASGHEVCDDDTALHTVFNRRFSDGYLKGRITSDMFIDSSRDQSLILLSTITGYHADQKTLTLDMDGEIDPATPLLIYTPDFKFICTGFIEKKTAPNKYLLRIEHELKGKISRGDILYALGEKGAREELQKRLSGLTLRKKPLTLFFSGTEGKPLEAKFVSGERLSIVRSTSVLAKARSAALTESVLADKLGMLGTTEFRLDKIDCSALEGALFLPLKELNELRRSGVAALKGDDANTPMIIPVPEKKSMPVRPVVRPRLACLISSSDDLRLCAMKEVTFLFGIPASIGKRGDSLIAMFKEHPALIPWFGPILIGDDFSAAIELIDKIKPSLVVSDNSGIGQAAGAANIPWIAGPLLNVTNSYALRCLSTYPGCKGAFISNELSKEQIRAISNTDLSGLERFEGWFSIFSPLLLMNTRQCLVRNCGACDKKVTDASCIDKCTKSAVVSDANDNPFFIEKRAGHYTQVFNGRHYFNPEIVRDVRNFFSTFVVDLRDIPSQTTVQSSKEALLKRFLGYLHNEPDSASGLRRLIRTTTAAQYTRGL